MQGAENTAHFLPFCTFYTHEKNSPAELPANFSTNELNMYLYGRSKFSDSDNRLILLSTSTFIKVS